MIYIYTWIHHFHPMTINWNLRESGVVSPSRLNPRRHFGLTLEGTGALRKCFSATSRVDYSHNFNSSNYNFLVNNKIYN